MGHISKTYPSLSAAFNNTAVSSDAAPASANADGAGDSFSLQDLEQAGWNPGQHVTVDGTDFALPNFGSGPDNVLAANQTISLDGQKGESLVFLATATNGNSAADHDPGDHSSPYVPDGTTIAASNCTYADNTAVDCSETSGSITYSDGQTAPQSYFLSVPDWVTGPATLSALYLTHRNNAAGQLTSAPRLYAIAVPIARNVPVASVTLPDLANGVAGRTPGLHIFGMAVRDTTSGPDSSLWTGAWSSPSEASAVNFTGTDYGDQTFRIAARPSVSGHAVRIKLSNRGGVAPLTIDHLTFAQQATGAASVAAPTDVTFNGSGHIVIPIGAEEYSDPLTTPVTADQPVLISFHLASTVHYIAYHSQAPAAVSYLSVPGSGDHTADVSASAFTGTGTTSGYFSDVVTGVDVVTDTDTQTVDVIGDNLVDDDISGTHPLRGDGRWRLAGRIATAVQADTSGNAHYGVVAGDIHENRISVDAAHGHGGGYSLLTRLSYDILSEPNLTTAVVDEGLQDIVYGTDDTELTTAYQVLLDQLKAWGIRAVVMSLTPCEGYAGCTAAADENRQAVNVWISDLTAAIPPGVQSLDASAAVAVDDPNSTTDPAQQQISSQAAPLDFDAGDHVNLSADGYAALASVVTSDLTVLAPSAEP